MKLELAGASTLGLRRSYNEDGYGLVPSRSIAVVFDGLGGIHAGEQATELLLEVVHAALEREGAPLGSQASQFPPRTSWARDTLARLRSREFVLPPFAPELEPTLLEGALREANVYLHALAREERNLQGAGATAAALALEGDEVVLLHAGDVRALRLRGGLLEAMTEDHSLLYELRWSGVPLDAETLRAVREEHSTVVTRALGLAATLKLDVRREPARAGDLYVLCTDGLHRYVEHEVLEATLRAGGALEATCRHLCALADAAGGADNATVVLAALVEES